MIGKMIRMKTQNPSESTNTRSITGAALTGILTLALTAMPGITPVHAAGNSAFLVGDFQQELGCSKDWDPACAATRMQANATKHQIETTVPAGNWNFKIALNGTWAKSYGNDGNNIPLILKTDTKILFTLDETTGKVGIQLPDLNNPYNPNTDDALVQTPATHPGAGQQYYFVLTDRFNDADKNNNQGGLTGSKLEHGYDPTDKAFYHGGDIKGITEKLDYLQNLGTTAVWLSPSLKNKPVQGEGNNATAGYHGYWITDFEQIDPHLGSNDDLKALIDAAHARGMKVYFDIIANHTADMVDYKEGERSYRTLQTHPYKDANGTPIDIAKLAGKPKGEWPALDINKSFPYTPKWTNPAEKDTLRPEWLNNLTLYHHRGDNTWHGESVTYGDFASLDDLMTEHPDVVNGMVEIYKKWVDAGLDGFRIDTVKHVNKEFWVEWSKQINAYAKTKGKPDFFTFGEVYDADAGLLSPYMRETEMNAVLDFHFQAKARDWVNGASGNALADLYRADDLYTTPTSNAGMLPTFLGNHDMGRIGHFVGAGTDPNAGAKAQLAHSLMYLTRGQPVVYYGDEQGFAGRGGDKESRQDMFPTQTRDFIGEAKVDGTRIEATSQFDETSMMYQHIAALGKLRANHPGLKTGAQLERWKENGTGIYAFSRVDRNQKIEYLVAVNNAGEPKTINPTALTKDAEFTRIYPTGNSPEQTITSRNDGQINLTVPAYGAVVYQANKPVSAGETPTLNLTPKGGKLTGRAEINANTNGSHWSETSFSVRELGTTQWQPLGVDTGDNARVFHDIPATAKPGTIYEYRAITTDAAGNKTADTGFGVVGADLTSEVDPNALDNNFVTLPGTFNSELGCTGGQNGDWDPACRATQMEKDPTSGWYVKELEIPNGNHEYKIALAGTWKENYGTNGLDGHNSTFTVTNGPVKVKFYFDPKSKYFFNTLQHPEYTIPGNFGDALGCGNWKPECLVTLMRKEADGTFVFETDKIPAGEYQFKIADHLNWDGTNHGDPNGPDGNRYLRVEPNKTVRITFKDGVINVEQTDKILLGEKEARAQWIDADTIAITYNQLDGHSHVDVEATLLTNETGGINVVGSQPQNTTKTIKLEPSSLDNEQTQKWPHLRGHAIYRIPAGTELDRATALRGSLKILTSTGGEAIGLTRVQTPGVLDSLYANNAKPEQLGVSWNGETPTLKLWAPTAKTVKLQLWDNENGNGNPTELAMTRADATGIWEITGQPEWKNRAYKYAVEVFVPNLDHVETNYTTDPYSTGLTPGSTHSVILNLQDPELKPTGWDNLRIPAVPRAVDQTIYELHVRDFSITDKSVPENLRGTYKAFTVKNSNGMQHLQRLADAGINSIHLLPTFDIATIPEPRENQATPAITKPISDPASEQPQAAVAETAGTDGFNWGYDPYHYQAPEGSYAVDPSARGRVREYREMVAALANTGENGLRLVADQVFNHLAESGQSAKAVFDRVVPGYYHRLNNDGRVENSTCCENLATEHAMMEKVMVDTVKMWARDYKVSGFRFDLMGHHSADNMKAIKAGLAELTTEKDGIDGANIHMYGEGWNFGEIANNARFTQATQGQLDGTNIGTFNDRLRDGVMGGHHNGFDTSQGFGSGQFTNPNPDGGNNADYWALSRNADLVRLGMAGNLREYGWETTDGYRTGKDIHQGGRAAGYALEPGENVNYIDAHDNSTLYDLAVTKLPVGTSMDDRVRYNTLQLATVALGQSPSFWHGGTDLLRSKSLDRDSYNAGDHFNAIDWSRQEHNFGVGLPTYEKNEKDNHNWDKMRPLLRNNALKASPAALDKAHYMALDLLKLRKNTPLMRLGTTELIKQKVKFPNQGAHFYGGMIAMHIDDTTGEDIDKKLEHVLVVLNADNKQATVKFDALKNIDFKLNDIQKESTADETVKNTQWDATTGTVTIPALTVAVLYAEQKTMAEKHQPTYIDQTVTRGIYTEPLGTTEIPAETTTTAGTSGQNPTAAADTPALPGGIIYAAGNTAPTWIHINPETGVITAFPGTDVAAGEINIPVHVTYPDNSTEDVTAKLIVVENQAEKANPQYQPVTATIGENVSETPVVQGEIPAETKVKVTVTPEIPGVRVSVSAAGELTVLASEGGTDENGNGKEQSTVATVTWTFPDGSVAVREVQITVPAKASEPTPEPSPEPEPQPQPEPQPAPAHNEKYPVTYPGETPANDAETGNNTNAGETGQVGRALVKQKIAAGATWTLQREPGLLPVGTRVAVTDRDGIKQNWTVTINGSELEHGVQPILSTSGFRFRLATVEANDPDFGTVNVTAPATAAGGESIHFNVTYSYPDGTTDSTRFEISMAENNTNTQPGSEPGDNSKPDAGTNPDTDKEPDAGANTGNGQPTPPDNTPKPSPGTEQPNPKPVPENPGTGVKPTPGQTPDQTPGQTSGKTPGKHQADTQSETRDQTSGKQTQVIKPRLANTGTAVTGLLLAALLLFTAGVSAVKKRRTTR